MILPLLALLAAAEAADFYSFDHKDIKGNPVAFETFRGKVSLVVNVASQCSQTEQQYKALKRLQDILAYKDDFNVLAFPSNDFGEQEPWEKEEIDEFVRNHFKAEFPLFDKIQVIGEDAHPAWKFLSEESMAPTWNFQKYLVDREGKVVKTWDGQTSVESIFDTVKNLVDNNVFKDSVSEATTPAANQDGEDKGSKDEL